MIKRYAFKYSKYKTSDFIISLIFLIGLLFILLFIFSFFVFSDFNLRSIYLLKIIVIIIFFISVFILSFYIIIKKLNSTGFVELYSEYFILKIKNKTRKINYADIKNMERIVLGENKSILPIEIKYTIKTNRENIKLYSSLLEGFKKTTFKERLKNKIPDYSIDSVMFQVENMMASYRISKI